ncbi:MAG TPA: ion channel [Bacteroidia bacterium]|nr:ion channel [Bacteroidia bacterium]
MDFFKNRIRTVQELGFGSKEYKQSVRFLNPDGSVNVRRTGLGRFGNIDIYHWLISTTRTKLVMVIVIWYIAINMLFAALYFSIGPEHFGGLDGGPGALQHFFGLFFFSAQTITTLGYGHVYPIGNAASVAAAFESLLGLLSFAVATGVLYGRFSRPMAHVLYSKNILIAPYRDGQALMFRLANKKQSELIESEVKVSVTFNNPETRKREFYNLNLEIEKIHFLTLSWTIVHPLNEESPLFGFSNSDFVNTDIEFLILLKSINDTLSQNVYSRYSYKANDLVEGAKFKPLQQIADRKGRIIISVDHIHQFEKL